MTLPRVVGLTGGMGTGKSVVAGVLRSLGHPVYDSDAAARSLYGRDSSLLDQVVSRFGRAILTDSGELDRAALAGMVFGDAAALADLNTLVHPAVAADFASWRKEVGCSGAVPWVFREAAILFESGSHVGCDRVWAVHAPLALRRHRVRLRHGGSDADFERRTAHQWTADAINRRADAVILNDGMAPLVPQVVKLVAELS